MTALVIITAYLALLLGLGYFSHRFFRGTAEDYTLASHTIGPVLLLLSLFGTTMTAFALVGSTGESYQRGIGVYGMLASSSGIVHSLCFFLIGTRLWAFGRRHGYTTQIQFFRARLDSNGIGLLLFPCLVGLVIPYLLIGVISSGAMINGVTQGEFEELGLFAADGYGLPNWMGSLAVSLVVMIYVFIGGMRGTAWANAFQTAVFMVLGVVTFFVIAHKLGGVSAASYAVLQRHPEKLSQAGISQLDFAGYLLIPLSVGMFPHVFQHWLTAKSAGSFKLPIVMHPILIMIVWLPCVLLGAWATSATIDGRLVVSEVKSPNLVLSLMVGRLAGDVLGGLLVAGILAAVMSSLDSQFLCLGTMFTHDILLHFGGRDRFSDSQQVLAARIFVVLIVALTFVISLREWESVFTMGIWCFSGFTGLFPLVFAAVYWRRLTLAGAYASILITILTWGYTFWDSGFGSEYGYRFLGMMPVMGIFACSAVSLVVVSWLTPSSLPRAETLARFFETRDDSLLA